MKIAKISEVIDAAAVLRRFGVADNLSKLHAFFAAGQTGDCLTAARAIKTLVEHAESLKQLEVNIS